VCPTPTTCAKRTPQLGPKWYLHPHAQRKREHLLPHTAPVFVVERFSRLMREEEGRGGEKAVLCS
jgi:hypothetical protein